MEMSKYLKPEKDQKVVKELWHKYCIRVKVEGQALFMMDYNGFNNFLARENLYEKVFDDNLFEAQDKRIRFLTARIEVVNKWNLRLEKEMENLKFKYKHPVIDYFISLFSKKRV